MTYYPKLAVLYYKDRNINIKVPIRIRLIKLRKYYCEHCNREGGLKRLMRYVGIYERISKETLNQISSEYDEKLRLHIYRPIFRSVNEVLCPECFFKHKIERIMTTNAIDKLKIYVNAGGNLIRIGDLLDRFTLFRWKEEIKNNVNCGLQYSYSAFGNRLDEMYKGVDWLRQSLKRKEKRPTNYSVKLIVNRRITMDQLEKDHRDYDKRRVIRNI